MDFKQNVLQIFHRKGDDDDCKSYHFKQIEGFWIPSNEQQAKI